MPKFQNYMPIYMYARFMPFYPYQVLAKITCIKFHDVVIPNYNPFYFNTRLLPKFIFMPIIKFTIAFIFKLPVLHMPNRRLNLLI